MALAPELRSAIVASLRAAGARFDYTRRIRLDEEDRQRRLDERYLRRRHG